MYGQMGGGGGWGGGGGMQNNPWLQQLAQRFQQHRMRGQQGGQGPVPGPGPGMRQGVGGMPPWGGGQGLPPQNMVGPQGPPQGPPPGGAPMPMQQQAPAPGPGFAPPARLQPGWMTRPVAGTPGPDGQMPTEQIKMGPGGYDGPDSEPDNDPDDRRRGY